VGERGTIALLCPEARLRRLLRLALLADGYDVLEWERAAPLPGSTRAIVADLDSLRLRRDSALAALQVGGVAADIPIVLISIYPPEAARSESERRLVYLQPPFAPSELSGRLAALLA
jgi:hypothetical protein